MFVAEIAAVPANVHGHRPNHFPMLSHEKGVRKRLEIYSEIFPPCFQTLTNAFSRNPFILKSIQTAGGCTPLLYKSRRINGYIPAADAMLVHA